MGLAKTFLAIGIAVILAVFVAYAVYVIYEPPKYPYESNTCYTTYDCQKQIDDCSRQYQRDIKGYQDCHNTIIQSAKYQTCQKLYDKCEEEFQKKSTRYIHSRNSFYILIVIGIITILSGLFLTGLEGIGSGLMGGGVLVVLWSLAYTSHYWLTLNKYAKLLALAIVLAILIYFGYKKLENRSKR